MLENGKQPGVFQDLDEYPSEGPWIVNSAVERVERLQSTAELNSAQRQKRRNDTLFIGMSFDRKLQFKEQIKKLEIHARISFDKEKFANFSFRINKTFHWM